MAGILILINPGSSKDETAKSMAPLIQFGKRLQSEGVEGAATIVTQFPSWGTFFDTFTKEHVAVRLAVLRAVEQLLNPYHRSLVPVLHSHHV